MEQDGKERKKRKLQEKAGVCYLSRIPPHLKPSRLRQLLSQYAEVLRIYMVPEDPAARKRRKRAGGNSGKNFTEGWVEFEKKSEAKKVAAMLNGSAMGGKRRSAHYYDLWNIKYLSKFKWDNLTEEIAYKSAVHEQKLAAEISAAKRERDFYLARVDQSHTIKSIEQKRTKKMKKMEEQEQQRDDGDDEDEEKKKNKVLRSFAQKKIVGGVEAASTGARLAPNVLAGVFGRKE